MTFALSYRPRPPSSPTSGKLKPARPRRAHSTPPRSHHGIKMGLWVDISNPAPRDGRFAPRQRGGAASLPLRRIFFTDGWSTCSARGAGNAWDQSSSHARRGRGARPPRAFRRFARLGVLDCRNIYVTLGGDLLLQRTVAASIPSRHPPRGPHYDWPQRHELGGIGAFAARSGRHPRSTAADA